MSVGGGKAANHPVYTVTWFDVINWSIARSEKDGLFLVYMVNGAVMRTAETEPTVKSEANGYHLPTEAEWEKAARGGLNGKRFPWGDTISHSRAKYDGTPFYDYDLSSRFGFYPSYAVGNRPYTSPVGSFAANGYGLYDMTGNLFEWCWDWYGYYDTGSPSDPRGTSSGTYRVGRGGGCADFPIYCRVADRNGVDPVLRVRHLRVPGGPQFSSLELAGSEATGA